MRKHHPRRLPRHRTAKNVSPQRGDSPQGLSLSPPPRETGPEPLYRVVYVIDVTAENAKQAAVRAYQLMKDPRSIRPVLDILDGNGRRTRVDLSQD
jgi:hypothetical protein